MLNELTHRTKAGLRGAMTFALLLAFVLCSMPSAFAQVITGTIQGTVTSSQGNTKLAGVQVTAQAPSGRYTATTDPNGFFSINGVTPDTYNITFTRTGYETFTLQGVTVVQGQVANATTALNQSLQRIGRTQSRSTAGAFQPTQTTDQYNVNTQQISTTLGKQGGNNEANLLASIPGASFDSSGYPVLRGGREYEEGFQYEGIDYTDAFTHQFVNSLILNGASNFQVQPGAGDASIGNAGTGAINVVAKRGTSPAFGQLEANTRFGRFSHELRGEYGWATPNGRYSDYASVDFNRDAFHYGGSNSDALLIGAFFGGRSYSWANDVVNNFVYKFGKDNNQSLQFFMDNTQFDLRLGYGVGPQGLPYKDTDAFSIANFQANFNGNVFGTGGPALTANQIQAVMPFTPGQRFLGDTVGGANNQRNVENYNQPNMTFKLQYSITPSSSSFLTAKFYRVDSTDLFDFPYAGTSTVFLGDLNSLQGGQRTGFALDGTQQLGSKNLLGFGAKYDFLHPIYTQRSATTALFAFGGFGNSIEAADFYSAANCPAFYTSFGVTCGYITGYKTAYNLSAAQCNPTAPLQVCPAGPVDPVTAVQLPYSDEGTHTNRQDWALYLKDTYSPTDRLKLDLGLRLDGANWRMPACTILLCAPTGFTAVGNAAPTAFAFNYDSDTRQPRVLQPRLAISWQATRNDAFRFSYGRSVQFPAIAQVDVTGQDAAYSAFRNIPSRDPLTGAPATFCSVAPQVGGQVALYQAPCANYADQLFWENQTAVLGIPLTPLKPVTFNNFDFSYSHLFPHQVSVKITPFYNKSYNQIASTAQQIVKNGVGVVDANGNPVLGPSFNTNLGKSQIMGTEFLLTKEAAYGLSGSLSLTYQNEFSNVVPTSPSEDFFPSIPPASLQLGNLYRVGYLSPFVGALALQERTRTGWRINPVVYYNHGYPYSPGLLTANYVNGVPYNLPNTNVTNSSQLGSAAGADRYVDPRNPGTAFRPNIDATRGTPDANAAGGVLTAARFTPVQLTVEYQSPRNPRAGTIGLLMFNVFNQLYGQPALNSRYQPIATGIAGPYSGYSSSANSVQPSFYGIYNYTQRQGNRAYLLTPNNLPRTVELYYQVNL
ncbi:MAG TPA: TonB-dependent receptor [Candidatus Limnocylindrales bacterium]|nr:TonB-dependent receptor [Candidatus Limnocylindrales bacterium]